MPLGSGRAYTRFPALQSCSHGEHIKCSPARAELAINLVYARPLPRGPIPNAEQSSARYLFLSAKARRKFDADLLTLLDVVDAKPAQKLYRYRKVPDRRGRRPHPYDYSVMFGSASTSNGKISPRSNLRRATSAIIAALSVQADKGGTVTRIP